MPGRVPTTTHNLIDKVMPQKATYFISRLIKVGELSLDEIINALMNPIPAKARISSFTITDFSEQFYRGEKYYFGRLTKFRTEGLVKVIDHSTNKAIDHVEPDLIIASSQFLFIPEYTCFVYQRIWNHIDSGTFSKWIREIILSSKERFFVDCKLEPLTDIKNFLEKVRRISIITQIKATVNPPNPLFGHLWKSLEKYLKKRHVDELKISEKAKKLTIDSNLIPLLQSIEDGVDLSTIDPNNVEIGDAAVLMSIDGYGSASIEGKIDQKFISIRTNQKSVQFHFPLDENIDDLYVEAKKILDNIKNQRYMSHE